MSYLPPIRDRFDNVKFMISKKVGTFGIAESKLDSSFPDSQCQLPGIKTLYCFDMNLSCGALLQYLNESALKVKQIYQHLKLLPRNYVF